MEITKKNFYYFIMPFIFVLSFFSYEYNIYRNYYQLFLVLVFLLGFILMIITLVNSQRCTYFFIAMKNNIALHMLSFTLLLATFFSSNKLGLITFNNFISIFLVILSMYVFFIYFPVIVFKYEDKIIKFLTYLITFFSIIGIIIGMKGSFFNYTQIYMRSASIFFDPNYFGTLSAVGFILCINQKGYIKLFSIINLLGLYYSNSRAAMLSLIITIIFMYFYDKRINIKKIILFLAIILLITMIVNFLLDYGFFRVHQGFNGRLELWELAYNLIKEEPISGYGYGTVGELFTLANATNKSSHNFFLDYTIMNGIPALVLHIIIIFQSLIRGLTNKVPLYVLMIVIFFLINMNSITISLGGLGAVSLLFTIFLGISNSYKSLKQIK